MYDSQNSLIANYINPIIGDMKVQDVTTRVVDKYIQTLQKTPAVNTRTHHAKTEFVTNATIEKIIKLLRCAFKQAVRWELVAKNPFDNVVLPKVEYKKRDIWTADMIRTALDQCTDSKLYVAIPSKEKRMRPCGNAFSESDADFIACQLSWSHESGHGPRVFVPSPIIHGSRWICTTHGRSDGCCAPAYIC